MATQRGSSLSEYKELLVGVTALQAEMKALRDDVRAIKDDTKETLVDHEARIRILEKWKWLQMGGAGAVGALISQLVSLFSGTIHL